MTDDERLSFELWALEFMDRLDQRVFDLADQLLAVGVHKELQLVMRFLKVVMVLEKYTNDVSLSDAEVKAFMYGMGPQVIELANQLVAVSTDEQLGLVVTCLKVFGFLKYANAPWSMPEIKAIMRDDLMEEIQKRLGETEFERCLEHDPRLTR